MVSFVPLFLLLVMVSDVDAQYQDRATLTANLGAAMASEVKDADTHMGKRAVAMGVITPKELRSIQANEKRAMESIKASFNNRKAADQTALDFLADPAKKADDSNSNVNVMTSYDDFAKKDDPLVTQGESIEQFRSDQNKTLAAQEGWKALREKTFNKLKKEGKTLEKEREERVEDKKEIKQELKQEENKIMEQRQEMIASLYRAPAPCPCQCPTVKTCPCNVVLHPCAARVTVHSVVQVTHTVSHCCHATQVMSSCCPSAHTLVTAVRPSIHHQGEIISRPNLQHTVKPVTVGYGKLPSVTATGVVMKPKSAAP